MKSDKRPRAVTMTDVAIHAGVSRALVSIVFRGVPGASSATRDRVMRAADELSYRPDLRARLLGSNRSRTVGVAFGLHHEFHTELVEALYGAVEATGYDLALGAVAPSRDETRAVQALLGYRCEALLLLGSTLRRSALEELATRVPVVVMARAVRAPGVDVVRSDDVTGARLAVEHLLSLGHERIAHVHGQRAPGAAERRRGYRAALGDAGLADREQLVPGGLTDEDGARAAALLAGQLGSARRNRLTAVTAFNDHCAAGLLAALRATGVTVPQQLSLVGYDDSHVAGLTGISLTTIAQDAAALARSALDLALARVAAPAAPSTEEVVAPRLVVRATTSVTC